MSRAVMQQALEMLEELWNLGLEYTSETQHKAAIDDLRAALAEPEQNPFGGDAERYARKLHEEREYYKALFTEHKPEQEPVAWVDPAWLDPDTRGWPSESFTAQSVAGWVPVFTAPTPRKPLTDEEIERVCAPLGAAMLSFTEVARAIERAHGIGEQT